MNIGAGIEQFAPEPEGVLVLCLSSGMAPMPTSTVSNRSSGPPVAGSAEAPDGGEEPVRIGSKDNAEDPLAARHEADRIRTKGVAVNKVGGAVDGGNHSCGHVGINFAHGALLAHKGKVGAQRAQPIFRDACRTTRSAAVRKSLSSLTVIARSARRIVH